MVKLETRKFSVFTSATEIEKWLECQNWAKGNKASALSYAIKVLGQGEVVVGDYLIQWEDLTVTVSRRKF